jgi:mono/diheme cytochrome c family protein
MPLAPRARPPVLPARRDFAGAPGYFYIADVYQGTHMRGVRRGAAKSLRVVESPEKRFWTRPSWNGQGQEAPAMNWHDFNNKRILGTVPIEADGSVAFAVPAERFVYFQLLDQDGMMIQSMRSGTMAQSGEHASCLGCHEDRRCAPATAGPNLAWTGARAPRVLADWHGPPRLFSYRAEVQPVFDRHCVSCHDLGKKDGQSLNLAGDRDLVFNISYNELWRRQMIRVVGAGPPEIQPAYAWGSHASKLVQVLRTNHYDARLSREELDRIATWIDLNAPYYPTYASAYPEHLAGRSPLSDAQLARLEQLTGVPLRAQADYRNNRGPQVSFERPELSPCVAHVSSPGSLEEALAIIRAGGQSLAQRPEADLGEFVPCSLDQWREQKYLARRQEEERRRAAIRAGEKVYDARGE